MIVLRKTNYDGSITTTEEEERLIEQGVITGFEVVAPSETISLSISDFEKPFRHPVTDKRSGAFKGFSSYFIRKY